MSTTSVSTAGNYKTAFHLSEKKYVSQALAIGDELQKGQVSVTEDGNSYIKMDYSKL